jgi:Replication protein C.
VEGQGSDPLTSRPPSWSEFLKAAELVRAMLGISPDAWRDAVETMGQADASIVVAAILQKGDEVRFPGGYLRALTEKKREGQFSVGPHPNGADQREAEDDEGREGDSAMTALGPLAEGLLLGS